MKLMKRILLAGSIPGGQGKPGNNGGSIPGQQGKSGHSGGSIPGKSENGNDVTCIVVDSLKKNEIIYVQTLRNWRDNSLVNSYVGKGFIKLYYTISPKLVKLAKKRPIINKIVRRISIATANYIY